VGFSRINGYFSNNRLSRGIKVPYSASNPFAQELAAKLQLNVTRFAKGRYAVMDKATPVQEVLKVFALRTDPSFCIILPPDRDPDEHGIRGAAIITRRDLYKSGETALEIATSPVIVVRSTVTLQSAIQIMNDQNSQGKVIDHLPIIDEKRDIIGLVTRDGIKQQLGFELGVDQAA
jgi:CBS domain-containing protein